MSPHIEHRIYICSFCAADAAFNPDGTLDFWGRSLQNLAAVAGKNCLS